MLEEIKAIKSGKKELREFGLTIGVILAILGLLALWRDNPIYIQILAVSGLLIGFGLFFPKVLFPIQKIWMSIAIIIGFFVNRLILSLLFYLVLTPIGLLMRLFGKDILDQKINKDAKTYWQDVGVDAETMERYEKQY